MVGVGIPIADDGRGRCGDDDFMAVLAGLPAGDKEYLGISKVEKRNSDVDSVTPRICFIVVDLQHVIVRYSCSFDGEIPEGIE